MLLIRTLEELKGIVGPSRPAFVPTMGALHEGHASLIRRAKHLAKPGSAVVASIFVNPTQFGPGEDYQRYPRMIDADAKIAAAAGADVIFAPEVEAIYPNMSKGGSSTDPPLLPLVATQPGLEDKHRPSHFAGVCQVVARLFDLIHPGIAIFGEKDYQQLLVIKAMVQQAGDRWPRLQIIGHPTVREPDGLAMSSRNAFLSPEQRTNALAISRAVMLADRASHPRQTEEGMMEILQSHRLAVDYAVVRDAATLMPIDSFQNPARALIAARLGSVRLIDNMKIVQSKA